MVERPLTVAELLAVAREHGVPTLEQRAFFKLGVGSVRAYVQKSRSGLNGECTRVDLSGHFPQLRKPAIHTLTEAEAQAQHLGRVRAQLNFDRPREEVLRCFRSVLEQIVAESPLPVRAEPGQDAAFLTPDLREAVERERRRMQEDVPRGVEISTNEAIRVLLWEAIEARRKT